jgi:hypothetical protein
MNHVDTGFMFKQRTTQILGNIAQGAVGSVGVLYWSWIDDTESANWQNINNTHAPGWTQINDVQTPQWELIET